MQSTHILQRLYPPQHGKKKIQTRDDYSNPHSEGGFISMAVAVETGMVWLEMGGVMKESRERWWWRRVYLKQAQIFGHQNLFVPTSLSETTFRVPLLLIVTVWHPRDHYTSTIVSFHSYYLLNSFRHCALLRHVASHKTVYKLSKNINEQ